jgi:hypothetical protein
MSFVTCWNQVWTEKSAGLRKGILAKSGEIAHYTNSPILLILINFVIKPWYK